MCTNPIGFQTKEVSKDYSFEKITKRVQSDTVFRRNDQENINFTGGEPTTHPRFLELCYWFRRTFPRKKIVLASNGRLFSYPWFAKKFLEINNVAIEIAILGPNKSLHDAITKTKGSFEQTIRGIHNILEHRNELQELELRIVLIKQNYKLTGEILDLILSDFPSVDRVIIIFPEPEGKCGKNYKSIGITYKQVKGKMTSVVKRFHDKFRELRLYHFPLCTLEPKLWKYTWITQRRDEVTYLSLCDNCSYRKYCCGIHNDYLKIIGRKEFKPIKKVLSLRIGKDPHHPILDIL